MVKDLDSKHKILASYLVSVLRKEFYHELILMHGQYITPSTNHKIVVCMALKLDTMKVKFLLQLINRVKNLYTDTFI